MNTSVNVNDQNNDNGIKFWLLYHAGLLLFSVIAGLLIKFFQNGNVSLPETYLTIATIFFISILLGYLASYMVKKGAKLSHAELTKRMVPYFLTFLVLSFIIANVVVSIGVYVYYRMNDLDLSGFFSHLFRYELSYSSRSIAIWLMLFSIVFFYILWRKSANKEQNLREEKLKYQYQTLKSQINPHFLFNSFSTLSEMVYEDAAKAERYIQELSAVYRYVIEHEEVRLVPLQEEMEFVARYIRLQKERLGKKLNINIHMHEAENCRIVPVSLQILVENAMKHNTATEKQPLQLEIYLELESVIVKNNLQKKNTLEPTTQKGLKNLREQTRLILNRNLEVVQTRNHFIVKMPITCKS